MSKAGFKGGDALRTQDTSLEKEESKRIADVYLCFEQRDREHMMLGRPTV